MERESFIVYRSFYALIKLLKPKERLEMYEAIFNYGFDMQEPKFVGNDTQSAIWQAIFPQLKANNKRYVNSLKGGAPTNNQNATKKTTEKGTEKQPNIDEKNNQTPTEKTTKKQPNENVNENDNVNVNENDLKKEIDKEKKEAEQVGTHTKRFIKPSLEEVEEYCKERNNNVDAQRFIDFYQSKGWKIGKEPMKDWKASVRTWEKQDKKEQKADKDKAWQNMSPIEKQRHMEALFGDT